jgi:hypothetical protein
MTVRKDVDDETRKSVDSLPIRCAIYDPLSISKKRENTYPQK